MTVSTSNQDERWLALLEAESQGDYLTPQERDFLLTYEAHSPSARAEQRAWRELQAMSRRLAPSLRHDDELIANVLAAYNANPTLHKVANDGNDGDYAALDHVPSHVSSANEAVGTRWQPRVLWASMGASVAAAAAAALVWWSPNPMPPANAVPTLVQTTAPAPTPVTPSTSSVGQGVAPSKRERELAWVMISGSAEQSGKLVRASGQVAQPGVELQVRDEFCVGSPQGARVCLDKGSRARVLKSEVELLAGKARFDGESIVGAAGRPQTDVQSSGLVVAGVHFAAQRGVYEVVTQSEQSNSVAVDVRTGSVAIDDGEGRLIAQLDAGDRLSLTGRHGARNGAATTGTTSAAALEPVKDSRQQAATTDAKELVAQARTWVGEGRYTDAAAAYEKAIRSDKNAALTRAAMVSLGQLYAERLKRPDAALRAFDAYLSSGGGPLAEEAHWGKIEALRALGRQQAEREAMDAFLRAYPSSSYADKVRSRLK